MFDIDASTAAALDWVYWDDQRTGWRPELRDLLIAENAGLIVKDGDGIYSLTPDGELTLPAVC